MPRRSDEDNDFLDSVSVGDLKKFRDSVFLPGYVASNPLKFSGTDWINFDDLRAFIANKNTASITTLQPTAALPFFPRSSSATTTAVRVKAEPWVQPSLPASKVEPMSDLSILHSLQDVKTRSVMVNNQEYLQILDSDEETDYGDDFLNSSEHREGGKGEQGGDSQAIIEPRPTSSGFINFGAQAETSDNVSSSPKRAVTAIVKLEGDNIDPKAIFNPDDFVEKSPTNWTDSPGLESRIIRQPFQLTTNAKTLVQTVKLIDQAASFYPMEGAIIIDLSDPKFEIYDNNFKLRTVDNLIKNFDQESFGGGSGAGNDPAWVRFSPYGGSILCRRVLDTCKGIWHCEAVDPRLVQIQRADTESATRDTIFAAQRKTSREEGNSVEKRTIVYFNALQNRQCDAQGPDGERCKGRPCLVRRTQGQVRYGKTNFIGCTLYKPSKTNKHRAVPIIAEADEKLLARLFDGQPISDDTETQQCSRVLSARSGGKGTGYCPHPHIVKGKSVYPKLVHRECHAKRTIFVPVDLKFRFAIMLHPKLHIIGGKGNGPHNHPLPPCSKVNLKMKATYAKSVVDSGVTGQTVRTIDTAVVKWSPSPQAPATKLLFGGQAPGAAFPALDNRRVKSAILTAEKKKKYTEGLSLPGVMKLWMEDAEKPVEDRYVHQVLTGVPGDPGAVMIFTFLASLMSLIQEVDSYEVDGTFKRCKDMEEQEMVTYHPGLKSVTLARVYHNRSSLAHYTLMYTTLFALIESVTGRAPRYKRFHRDGNLLSMGSDLEQAEVLGAAAAILPDHKYRGKNMAHEEARVIQMLLSHGISKNNQTDLFDRISRRIGHTTTTINKVIAASDREEERATLEDALVEEQQQQQQSKLRLAQLRRPLTAAGSAQVKSKPPRKSKFKPALKKPLSDVLPVDSAANVSCGQEARKSMNILNWEETLTPELLRDIDDFISVAPNLAYDPTASAGSNDEATMFDLWTSNSDYEIPPISSSPPPSSPPNIDLLSSPASTSPVLLHATVNISVAPTLAAPSARPCRITRPTTRLPTSVLGKHAMEASQDGKPQKKLKPSFVEVFDGPDGSYYRWEGKKGLGKKVVCDIHGNDIDS
ncbi:hypothetical protein C8J56DRAFT_1039197 [Mycena floridula]|nr:hypothetical protein C8J56DRAFT_1039197 [Mycena floridula]